MRKCCVCLEEKKEVHFLPRQKWEAGVTPYCSKCRQIYYGISQHLIPAEDYVGKNYNYELLDVDKEDKVVVLYETTYDRITLKEAIHYIQQGAAHVMSTHVIKMFSLNKPNSGGVGLSLRNIVNERDQMTCRYCGKDGTTLDHVIPQSKGGLHTLLNLVCACKKCNADKGSKALVQFLAEDARRMMYFSKVTALEEESKTALSKNSIVASNKVKLKKPHNCSICETPYDDTLFAEGASACKVCEKYKEPLAKGWLTVDRLKTINVGRKKLKGAYILAEDFNGDVQILKKAEARKYLQNGLAELMNSFNIRFLFSKEQMKELIPVQVPLTEIADRFNSLLKGPQIAVYNAEDTCLAVIDSEEAESLIRKKSAQILVKNRIRLMDESMVSEVMSMTLKKKRVTKKQTEISSEVSVFTDNEGYMGVLNRHYALEFLDQGKASLLRHNRIHIPQEHIESVVKKLHNVEVKKIQIKEPNGIIIGAVPKIFNAEFEQLIQKGLAIKENDYLLALKKPIKQIAKEQPELVLFEEIKKIGKTKVLKEA